MTALEILQRLDNEGVVVTTVGDGLKVRALRASLTDEQKQLIVDNKALLLAHFGTKVAAPPPLVNADSCEETYREYVYPDGEVLKLTRDEFNNVVDVFRMLLEQDTRLREQDLIKLSLREKGIFEPDRTPPRAENLVE